MKRTLLTLCLLGTVGLLSAQIPSAFKEGEWLKFRMSYSGWMKAGNATLSIQDTVYNGREVYRVIGDGWTTGAIKWFFKVEDHYESYFDKTTNLPYRFIRDIDEGGHTKNIEILFDHDRQQARINNIKRNQTTVLPIENSVQDMVSAYYFLRNNYETDEIKPGDEIQLNMFFDYENFKFKLRFLGFETIRTRFGKVKCLKFRPYVLAGRVFKEEESLTLWVSNDKNKIPLRVKADLAVGSLRADLEAFKGLKHPFEIQFD